MTKFYLHGHLQAELSKHLAIFNSGLSLIYLISFLPLCGVYKVYDNN